MARSVVIRDCQALTPAEDGLRLTACDIVVADGRIAALAAPGTAPADPDAETLPGSGRLAVPGLVNAHTHSPSNLLRGTADGMGHVSFMWANQADNVGRSDEEAYVSAMLGALDMIRSGITGAIDHYPEQNCTVEAVAPVARAYADSRMRTAIALRIFDQGYDDIDPANIDGAELALAAELAGENPLRPLPADELGAMCVETARRWHGHEGRLAIFPAPSNPMRCSDELLSLCHRIAEEHDLGLHCHLLETRIQKEIAAARYGRSMVAHMDELGVLGPRWSLAHSVWVDPPDVERLAERKAVVVHNPHSNAKIGAGVAPVASMIERGVPVALGSDGANTNDTLNLHEAMSLALLLPRIAGHGETAWPDARAALDMATLGGAAAMQAAGRQGSIAPGMRADLVLYDLASPTLAPLNDPVQQLVFSERGRSVETVLVAGEIVYRDGRFAAADVDAVIRDAARLRRGQIARNPRLRRFAQRLDEAQRQAGGGRNGA